MAGVRGQGGRVTLQMKGRIMSKLQRYLILPARGLQATPENTSTESRDFLINIAGGSSAALSTSLRNIVTAGARVRGVGLKPTAGGKRSPDFKVVESLHEDGVKLVNATPEMIAAMRFEQPGLRVAPEVFYSPARFRPRLRKRVKKAAATTGIKRKLVVTVTRGDTNKPVKGAYVVAFTNFEDREGVDGTTSAAGAVTLASVGTQKFERLYVMHEMPGLWSYYASNVGTKGVLKVSLRRLDLSVMDSLRHFHAAVPVKDGDGAGVSVGVIDSGVALDHPDLQVKGGLGCVPGEDENDWGAYGSHGTHVAGIIAGRGKSPTGMRGMAPGATIYSYRVFGNDPENSGSNFALVKAVERGIKDECDLLNMSLGYDPDENGMPQIDVAVQEAIREAHKRGVLVIAAAGNDGRKAVNFPAIDDLVVAVSALGRIGTFPVESSETADILAPFGADKKDFVAAFSNIGTELDAAGAGVGVVSTVPGGYAPMSGTSMACPAVTGVLARLLAKNPGVLGMKRDSNRADAMKALLFAHSKSIGFGVGFEGKGLPT